jgi:hypothetical protein
MIYSCTCCKFESSLKKDYYRHLSTNKHINNFKNNKYCDICKKEFACTKSFRVHWKSKHEDESKTISDSNEENSTKKSNKILIKKSKSVKKHSEISYNKIKKIIDESTSKVNDKVNEKLNNVKEEMKMEVKEEINKSNTEVVNVVNKAINRASSLIKYLMEHHQNTPPLRKIKQKDSIELLRIDYKCPVDKKENKYALEKIFINDYKNDLFVRNICKSILNLVNYKNPEKQPIWNTDSTRYNYVIKTTMDKWAEDKSGIKFSDYVIKPLLNYIRELISNYRINEFDNVNVKKFNSDQIKEYYTYLNLIYRLENDILCDNLIKNILKELSPYLRYLQTELEELEGLEELEKLENSNVESIKELKTIQQNLINIVNNSDDNIDNNSDNNSDNNTSDNNSNDYTDNELNENNVSIYRTKNGKIIKIYH